MEEKIFNFNNFNVTANIHGIFNKIYQNTIKGKDSVSYTLDDIKGITGTQEHGLLILAYTCGVCNSKQARSFTKHAYQKGVVLIR